MSVLRRTASAAAAVALAATVLTLPATSAEAATSVLRFSKVYYNSPGSDTGSNSSLNGEWIRITNYGSGKHSLTGWTVRDKQNHVYKFGTFTLSAGSSVTLYTGAGTNSWNKRYWHSAYYIWNNTGDTAYLRDASGTSKDSCSWGSTGASKYC